jgi:hypothetical protein
MTIDLTEIAGGTTVTEVLFERVIRENRPGPLTPETLKDIYHVLHTIGMFQYKMKDPLKISEMKPEYITAFHALKKIGAADSAGTEPIAFLTPFGNELDQTFTRDLVYDRRVKDK